MVILLRKYNYLDRDMMKSIVACVISVALLTGCGPKDLSQEQIKQVEDLKVEMSKTDVEISSAIDLDKQYSGGLIKSLVRARLEVLKTNKALLEQRVNAIESGAKIKIDVSGFKPNMELASSLEKEINTLKGQILEAKSDAEKYTGGLVLSMKLAAIATQEQTLAVLEQRYLFAKYGLPEVGISSVVNQTPPTDETRPTHQEEKKSILPALNGPFGLQEGLTKKNIEDMIGRSIEPVEGNINLYITSSLPKENSDFTSYGLLISPTVGLCQIRAIGKNIDTDSYGLKLQSTFDDLKKSLDSLYGNGEETDILLSGSIWKNPNDWMMGLIKQERFLSAKWNSDHDAMKKNSLSTIWLEARAQTESSGYILLQYVFNNDNTCQSEIDGERKNSL